MGNLLLAICMSLLVVYKVNAAATEDMVVSLPGLSKPTPWKQYSGYLQASGTKKLHYWFIESADKPEKAPVVLWLNGGPGCSSDLGLLTEHGPFRVSSDGNNLTYNKYSWNTVANMLYLEAPAGVGFSYSDDKNYTTDDDLVATDNLMAVQDFFKKFPEFKANEFFVTGESYGGIYVPTLSTRLLSDTSINFKGMAIGNGIMNYNTNDDSLLYFGYYHGLLGEGLWDNMILSCCDGNSTQCPFSQRAEQRVVCGQYVQQASSMFMGLNEYSLYAKCQVPKPNGVLFTKDEVHLDLPSFTFTFLPDRQEKLTMLRKLFSNLENVRLTPPCLNYDYVIKYMRMKEVKKALHIPDVVQPWDVCSATVGMKYRRIYNDVTKFYTQVLAAGKRVLVYNGDTDMACNFLGDEWFIEKLELPVVAKRQSWKYRDVDGSQQIAGFVKKFKNLTLLTVRGAGHMVPQDKPIPALDMFSNFIFNS